MVAISWDKVGERLYETGVDHGVLYIPDNTGVYTKGHAWNGLTAVSESPSGAEANPQYADNIKYLNLISAEEFGATIEAFPIVFLGNVDAKVESSARFRLPSGEQFLKIAQEYRNPENFIKTALVPAIKETLQATASLMSADDFYAGARSEFAAEFENQLYDGLYLIKRKEIQEQQEQKMFRMLTSKKSSN